MPITVVLYITQIRNMTDGPVNSLEACHNCIVTPTTAVLYVTETPQTVPNLEA